MTSINSRGRLAKSTRRMLPNSRSGALLLGLVLGMACALAGLPARAQNAYCDNLRAQIASVGSSPGAARYQAAAAKQRSELGRTANYARSIGCDRQQFLFFGNPPPPQCGQINARIAQMQANLASLERNAGEGQRQALIARYDAQCRQRVAARPRNFFEELFGVPPDGNEREIPAEPLPDQLSDEGAGRGLGGSMAICVRTCDGGFFPVSYAAGRGNLEELGDLCKALCPNVEVTLYTKSPSRDVDTALSVDGEPYSNHPNALKFQKTFDPSCTCKPPGKSWVEALADAERILAERHSGDTMVTAERAEELSRPIAPGDPRSRRSKSGAASKDEPAVPAPSTDEKSIGSEGQGTTRDVVGPDGVKRRVRVIAPML